ncbi:MAG: type II toxin-antitoxin system RelE/ParE family toxin [Nitrospirae bacterium]|nr:type II toxin-antitoxin system RelE/ParE family toxin [Nitrospirota bacterium]
MIRSFRHKGLEKYFYDGDKKGINVQHANRLGRILDRLDASISPQDMNLPGFKLHELKGKEKSVWAVWVSGNWRVTFKFHGNDAILVDYRDYH